MAGPPTVDVQCPECLEVISVVIGMQIVDGNVNLEPDVTPVWDHVFTHVVG